VEAPKAVVPEALESAEAKVAMDEISADPEFDPRYPTKRYHAVHGVAKVYSKKEDEKLKALGGWEDSYACVPEDKRTAAYLSSFKPAHHFIGEDK